MWICGARGPQAKETGLLEEIMLSNYYRNQQLLMQAPASISDQIAPRLESAKLVIETALGEGRKSLNEMESKALLAAFRAARQRILRTNPGGKHNQVGVEKTVVGKTHPQATISARLNARRGMGKTHGNTERLDLLLLQFLLEVSQP